MLSPLSKSEHTINDNFEFINYMRTISIPSDNKLMSFDVKLLFINIPLDFTTNLILKKSKLKNYFIYVQKMYILVTLI